MLSLRDVSIILVALITPRFVLAAQPEVVVTTNKEIAVGSGALSETLVVNTNVQSRALTDHIMLFENLGQSTVNISYVTKSGMMQSSVLLISEHIANAKITINISSREYSEDSVLARGVIWTNVPDVMLDEITLTLDGVSIELGPNREFSVLLTGEGTLESAVVRNSNVLASAQRVLGTTLNEDWGCDFTLEGVLLNALCFSDKNSIEDIAFVLDDKRVGGFGETTVDPQNSSLFVYLLFKSQMRKMSVKIQDGVIDVQEENQDNISDRLSTLLRKPRKVY